MRKKGQEASLAGGSQGELLEGGGIKLKQKEEPAMGRMRRGPSGWREQQVQRLWGRIVPGR